MKVIQLSLINQLKNQINMLEKVEVLALLADYHKQVSAEQVDHLFIEEFYNEAMALRDEIIERSYTVDFDFDDL